MQIEVIIPDEIQFKTVETKVIPARGEKPELTIYLQPVVFKFGSWDMKESSVKLESPVALKPGNYSMDLTRCFSVGRFNKLEFDQYQARFVAQAGK